MEVNILYSGSDLVSKIMVQRNLPGFNVNHNTCLTHLLVVQLCHGIHLACLKEKEKLDLLQSPEDQRESNGNEEKLMISRLPIMS